MKMIGYLIMTSEGLAALSKSAGLVYGKKTTLRIPVWQTEDTHKGLQLSLTEDSGCIDLCRPMEEKSSEVTP